MLHLTTVCLIALGIPVMLVDAKAKASFNLFNKNLLFGVRPAEESARTGIEGGGQWMKIPNFGKPEDSMNYGQGAQSSAMPNGVNSPASDGQTEGQTYTMFFKSDNHTRCEECDKDGKIKGTMVINDNGVQKMINYEALSAKNSEATSLDGISNGARAQSALDGLAASGQSYNQFPAQVLMSNNIPVQMSSLGMPQSSGLPSPSQPQLPQQLQQQLPQQLQQQLQQQLASQQLPSQQNSFRYMFPQADNAIPNGLTPQNPPTLSSYNQLPVALGNAGQTNPQTVVQQLADPLAPPNQLIAQRVNELMNNYPNQPWNGATRQIPGTPSLAIPPAADLTSPSPDAANFAALKGMWPNNVAVPVVLMNPTTGQNMFTMANLGGLQPKDNSVGAVLSKEQTVEYKSEDAAENSEVNTVMKKLADMIERMPKIEESKETTEPIASPGR